jgi:hypothetical protein
MRKRLKIAKQNFKNQSKLTSRGSGREPTKKETDMLAKDASTKNPNLANLVSRYFTVLQEVLKNKKA